MKNYFPELSCYLLPGHTRTPADAITEAQQAEALGLGKVWLSERFDVKEAGVVCSAALAVTENIKVATAATNLHTRHPLALASMCSSLHYISGGRFELGLARGVAIRNQLMGLEAVTNKQIADGLDILRKLFSGETVGGYDGPMGNLPYLKMGDWMDVQMPIHFVGFGPKSLRFAGKHFDGVHLHPFITEQGLQRAKKLISEGAESAGRKSEDIKICSVLITVPNPSREDYLRKVVARMATYMQAPGYIEMLVDLNGWDQQVVEDYRAHPLLGTFLGAIDSVATLKQLEEIETLIPKEWLSAIAIGTADECAERWKKDLDNGANEVCIHGSTPDEFTPILESYQSIRD